MTAHWTTLRATTFGRDYYEQHLAAGLDYAHFGDWQFRYCRWLCDALALEPFARVLDLGCACGNLVEGFRLQHRISAGIDASQHMIELGRQRFPLSRDRLFIGNVADLPALFADRKFDFLHSMQCAEHWEPATVAATLRGAFQIAAPDALFWLVLDTTETGTSQGRDLVAEDPTHRCIRPRAWWLDQLAAAGWIDCTEDFRVPLTEHGWSYFDSHDWQWIVCRRAANQSPLPLARVEDWFIRPDLAFADCRLIDEVYHQNCYQLASRLTLPTAPTVLDLGASIGPFSRLVHSHDHRARIVAVEPDPSNAAALTLNCPFAHVVRAAVTYEPHPAWLSSTFPGSTNSGAGRIIPADRLPAADDPAADPHVRRAPLPECLTLEALLERVSLDCKIDLLKLDVEGSEFSIFANAQTLARFAVIVGEYHGDRWKLSQSIDRVLPTYRSYFWPHTDTQGLFVIYDADRARVY